MVLTEVYGAHEGAGLAELGEELGFWGGLEEGGEVVTEDAGEDLGGC